eukprot:scaffold26260_cov126-Isochrysis_galbana.AAC.3
MQKNKDAQRQRAMGVVGCGGGGRKLRQAGTNSSSSIDHAAASAASTAARPPPAATCQSLAPRPSSTPVPPQPPAVATAPSRPHAAEASAASSANAQQCRSTSRRHRAAASTRHRNLHCQPGAEPPNGGHSFWVVTNGHTLRGEERPGRGAVGEKAHTTRQGFDVGHEFGGVGGSASCPVRGDNSSLTARQASRLHSRSRLAEEHSRMLP